MHQSEAAKIKREACRTTYYRRPSIWKEVQTSREGMGIAQRPSFSPGPHRYDRLHDGLRHHGVEPDIALVKYKKLVGGGVIKIVNQTVPEALTNLKYTDTQVKDILAYSKPTTPSGERRT